MMVHDGFDGRAVQRGGSVLFAMILLDGFGGARRVRMSMFRVMPRARDERPVGARSALHRQKSIRDAKRAGSRRSGATDFAV